MVFDDIFNDPDSAYTDNIVVDVPTIHPPPSPTPSPSP